MHWTVARSCIFNRSWHDWTPRFVQSNLHQNLGIRSSYSKLHINKKELNLKTQGNIPFPSKHDGWKNNQMKRKIQERNMMWHTVPTLTWLCTLRRPPDRGAQAISCFFPGFKYSGKFWFLACSGDREPLVIYALTCPSLALEANNMSEKNTKVSIKSLPSSVSLVSGIWSFLEYRELNCNLFLEAWLENQTDLHGHLRRWITLPTWRKNC